MSNLAGPLAVRAVRLPVYLLIGACLALLLYAFHPVLPDLWAAWQTDEYSHGILIPFIALLLGWHKLAERQPVARPSFSGPAIILAAGLLLLISRLSAFSALGQYGLIIALLGVVLGFPGRQAAFILAPAFVYLAFAVPLPHIVYARLSQELQLASSTLGVAILDALGVPVYQEGNVIDLAGIRLQVVEACSGLRYLFPLMSFGYLIAWLLDDRWWKRLVLFLSSVPIAIALNALRIAVIGVTVELWGNGMAEGFIHGFEGWVIFLICGLILLLEMALLRRVGPRGHFRLDYLGLPHGKTLSGELHTGWPGSLTVLATLLLALTFGTGLVDNRPQITVGHPAFAGFPLSLPPWRGQAQPLARDVLQALALSDYWQADYRQTGADAAPVSLYMAYYDTERAGAAPHSPANCIPGGGWQIAETRVITIPAGGGQVVTLSRLLIRKAETAQLVYYWFDERGRDITGTTMSKLYALHDAITMQRTDGALIRLVTPLNTGEGEDAADRRLADFLRAAYPAITRFVPGGSE